MPKFTAKPEGILRATTSFIARVGAEDVMVKAGDLADADSAIVKAHPALFEPAIVRFAGTRVEQATAAPGEKRGE
jgi:hypothetical protein